MAKTRKSELDLTGAAAAPAPVRRRASTTSNITRKTTAPTKRAETSDVVAEITVTEAVIVEDSVEILAGKAEPTQEEIAALAYSYWVDRGYQGGSPEEDWLRAERELCG
jgi:hypothetical protein